MAAGLGGEGQLRDQLKNEVADACQFTSGDNHYYKTPEMMNLDEHYGDLDGMIQGQICRPVVMLS